MPLSRYVYITKTGQMSVRLSVRAVSI